MRALAAACIIFLSAGCIDIGNGGDATVRVDFDGQAEAIEVQVTFDTATRPSHASYESTDVPHPDGYTVHDLMVDSEIEFTPTYRTGVGYSMHGIQGVLAGNGCFWALWLDGSLAETGMTDTFVEDGAVVEWRLTGCE